MATSSNPRDRLNGMAQPEFIALMAMLMALNALAVDIMLPALDLIGHALGVENDNDRQYVVSSYLLGLGVAQLFYGPVSDRFGRRAPMLFGIAVYCICSFAMAFAPSFSALLILRFIQGAGAAATRVITVSVIRDLYAGRAMAEVMSLIMMVFMIVPVLAPATGQGILFFGDWHLIFVVNAILGVAIGLWMYFRLSETLSPADIRPFTPAVILDGFRVVLTNRIALCYTLATTFILGALFGFINSAQQIYIDIYGIGPWFPVAFAGVALFMSASSFINSRLVRHFGARRLAHASLLGFIAVNLVWLIVQLLMPQPMPLALFLAFFSLAMFQFGWIGGNFNTLAMQPLGHVAGTASSVLGFVSTVGGSLIGLTIGQAFNGTATPLIAGFFTVSMIGLFFVLLGEKGRLFRRQAAGE